MTTVVLVIHIMIAVGLIVVVLMQRSEGGALGIGGGGGAGGGFLTGRGTANLLTRTTAVLACAFFATSILLTILANRASTPGSLFESPKGAAPAAGDSTQPAAPADGAPAPGGGGILDDLQKGRAPLPSVPGSR